jgi:hypothetical protein
MLADDITVGSGQSSTMDVVLRDDSASLAATVKSSNGIPAQATVVVVPQPQGKASPHLVQGSAGELNLPALAPGDYLVFAFDRAASVEYDDPDALAAYAAQAARVTLSPSQQAQVSLDLIPVGKGD